jgi:hypothetical protein
MKGTDLYYMLNEHGEPVPVADVLEWMRWFERAGEQRRVAQTEVFPDVEVSTVFLGLDHGFVDHEPPILWETLVFGGKLDGEMMRYTTRAKAEAGHHAMIAQVRAVHHHD